MPAKKVSATPVRPLAGKVAVITGASRGIGFAIADALAASGCNLAIAARRADTLKNAAKRLQSHKVSVLEQSCDVSDAKAVENFFRAIKKQFGKVDILINNAGMAHPLAEVEKLPLEVWQQVIQANLSGLFLVTRSALPLMDAGGTIVNNLSIASK